MRSNIGTNLAAAGWLFLRYVGGLFVANFVSILGFMFIAFSLPQGGWDLFWLPPSVAGFLGVFCGSWLVPRNSRWIASLLFLALGVGFYWYFWRMLNYQRAEPHEKEFPHVWFLVCGGLIAVAVHCCAQRLQAREPKDTAPS